MTELVVAPKKAIAIALMIAFIIVCVLAPFGAAHAIVGISSVAITILIAALAAVGITFTTTGAFDTLEEYVESLLQEYAQDNNIPVTSVFNGASWQASAAGKLLLNNVLVREISAIATWIKFKFNLINNQDIIVQSPDSINGIIITPIPYNYRINTGVTWEWYYTASSSPVYLVFYKYSTSLSTSIRALAYSAEPFVMQIDEERVTTGAHTYYNYTGELNVDYYFAVGKATTYNSWTNSHSTAPLDKVFEYDGNETNTLAYLKSSLDGIPVAGEEIGISTGTITIPTDDTNYTDTTGAILDVHAPWSIPVSGVIDTIPDAWSSVQDDTTVYTLDLAEEAVIEQQLPQPSDIENLPGATIPGIPDIDGEPWHLEFSNLWHYVAQWISDMSAGGAVIWNTCVQAPPPVVNLVFVGIVLAMWFGAIKILR